MNYVIDSTSLSSIADAIRSKTGKSSAMQVSEMPEEIESIITEPAQIEKSITANGVYNASDDNIYGYSKVIVDVPLPENGYLLKELSGLPDDEAIITDASALPLAELKAEITPKQTGTPWWANGNDLTPYLFRPSPQLGNDYNHENDKIVGGSVAWNQLVQNGDFADTTKWSAYDSSKISLTIANGMASTSVLTAGGGGYTYGLRQQNLPATVKDHYYLVEFSARLSVTNTGMLIDFEGTGQALSYLNGTPAANVWNRYGALLKANIGGKTTIIIEPSAIQLAVGDTIDYKDVQIYDLTLMFGSTITNYIVSLSTNADRINWLKSQGFFTKDYYAYDAGSIKSVQTSAKKTVGFNQWDEEYESGQFNPTTGEKQNDSNRIRSKNFIKVVPNQVYHIKRPVTNYVFYYDENKTYLGFEQTTSPFNFTTPQNCYFLNFSVGSSTSPQTTYNNNICINLHWDGERDGEYEAYEEHTYPLDSDLELRGIAKLDSSNNLYYDGDIYASDGTVTRRYGIVDLGTLNYTYDSTGKYFYSSAIADARNFLAKDVGNLICAKYITVSGFSTIATDKSISIAGLHYAKGVNIKDSAYSDATTFKTAISGVYLVYEKETPTTESADTYQNPQIVSNFGTEQFVDERDVPVPVGHETRYYNEAPIVGFTEMVITRTAGADSKTYTVALSGTVYGGVLDVVSGELTITYGIVDLGTLNWSKQGTTEYPIFRGELSTVKNAPNESIANIVCSKYCTCSYSTISANADMAISSRASSADGGFMVRDTNYLDAATFKTSMSGAYAVYELATSTVVQLTPTAVATLLGSNTLTASTGDIASVKYFSKE